MSNTSTSSLNSFFHRPRSDSNPHSISSRNSIPLRFSTQKILTKAKDSTKALVQDVLEKRHSVDSKRSSSSSTEDTPSKPKRSESLTSIDKLKQLDNNNENDAISSSDNGKRMNKTLSSRPKHYSLPIRRPFTIKKPNSKSNDSLSSASTSVSTEESSLLQEVSLAEPEPVVPCPLSAAAAAEADILAGTERPGSFATACDFRLADEKRNDEFHALFKSVQDGDMLIQGNNISKRNRIDTNSSIDYKCALQKEILLQGHLFISEHHVCFKSNIFGWVTNVRKNLH
jgi:hypothetical protein